MFLSYTYDEFISACSVVFESIIHEYSMHSIEKHNTAGVGYAITFNNDTSAIWINYELRGNELFIGICKLVNGVVPKGYNFGIYCFTLENLIARLALDIDFPGKVLRNERNVNRRIRGTLILAAEIINTYMSDMLLGDFTAFENK